ncbi:lipase family protein [Streptomyces zagrosensis]|uniref:Integral membrane protein n=1 Tax=Streptomyces zagrosensis TaxID=1042984 RepID=A0A7W9Q856_9ACTN|nr:lipase family protein [Streptomyces zagrosensis]MBB5935374.1 hypothetical protein [Streptomyces zagrosensis]
MAPNPSATHPKAASRADTPPHDPPPEAELALELLVHGVGGATPSSMLDADPRVQRMFGDETAGVYRRTEDADAEQRPADYRDRPVPEAYCWSGLTSGDGTRALWLLLLPFMVINLAHWMRPAADRREGTVRLYGVLVRLIALTLTVLLVAAVCEVALDLVAWQCAGSASCTGGRGWMDFAAPAGGGWWSQPGRRLALAAVVPLAVIVLLSHLSTRTWSAYESSAPIERQVNEDDVSAAHHPALRLPGFWYGRRLVARLQAVHTAAGLLTIAAALTLTAARYDRAPGGSALLDATGWALLAVIHLAGLVVLYVMCRRGRSETTPDHTLDRLTAHLLPGISLILLVLAAGYAGWSRPGWASSGRLPGDQMFGVIALTQITLIVLLAVVAAVLHRSAARAGHRGGLGPQHVKRGPKPPTGRVRTPLWGLGGPAVAVLACSVGGVLTGGVAQRIADWLDGGATPGMGGGPIAGPPVLLSWQAAVIPPLLVFLVLLLLAFVWGVQRVRLRLIRTVPDGYPGERPDKVRTEKIAGTIARAGITDSMPWIIGPVALLTLLLGCLSVAGAWGTGEVPGRAADGTPAVIDAAAQTAQALGSWLVGVAFALFITWGRRAYRDPGARRTIGILWDVGTFWPRAAHPFAPPCYAERAVPDLTWRMQTWTERTGGRLVISGHSQGSVLAAAAVWQLNWRTRRRVALLTYGSPLERLYGRWFPAYFGPAQLSSLHAEVHCWRNLWRYTDPIGGPIEPSALADARPADDRPHIDCDALKDPLVYGRTAEHPLPAPIRGHSEYQADPAFVRERAGLLARLPGDGVPRPRTAASAPDALLGRPADGPDTGRSATGEE